MVETALGEGNTLVTGGSIIAVDGCEGGAFFEPTIIRGATRDSYITRNEVFGPVLAVVEIDSFDDAIETVNDCEYGLSAAVYTRDVNQAMRAVHAIDTGIVYVNAPTIGAEIHLPFGGTKHTGNGYREAGKRGLEQFSETKSVYIDFSGRLQKAQIDNRAAIEAIDV
jgi:alpha-ketoglutaric semialdehyde dehydrogenase